MRATTPLISRPSPSAWRRRSAREGARQRALAAERDWISASPKARQGKVEGPRGAPMTSSSSRPANAVRATRRSSSRQASGWARWSSRRTALTKGFGDTLFDRRSVRSKLPPGGIVGVIGPNGAGKTTLFRMLTGQEKPDGGEIRIGDTVKLSYVDQSRDTLDPNKTVWGRDFGRQRHHQARQARSEFRAPTAPPSPSRAATSSRRVGTLSRRPAQPRASGQAAQGRRQRHPAR